MLKVMCRLHEYSCNMIPSISVLYYFSLSLSLSLSLSPPSGEFVSFIRASKVNLVARMRVVFLNFFTPYEDIFDEFYSYLERGVVTGNLCELEEKFTKVRSECVCEYV